MDVCCRALLLLRSILLLLLRSLLHLLLPHRPSRLALLALPLSSPPPFLILLLPLPLPLVANAAVVGDANVPSQPLCPCLLTPVPTYVSLPNSFIRQTSLPTALLAQDVTHSRGLKTFAAGALRAFIPILLCWRFLPPNSLFLDMRQLGTVRGFRC